MTDTFKWKSINNPSGTTTFDETTAQFGDGYSQEVPNGINPISDSWPLTFVGTKAEMDALTAFLRAHVGQSFFMTPPSGVQGLYKTTGYTLNPQGGAVWTVTATFQQKFSP